MPTDFVDFLGRLTNSSIPTRYPEDMEQETRMKKAI